MSNKPICIFVYTYFCLFFSSSVSYSAGSSSSSIRALASEVQDRQEKTKISREVPVVPIMPSIKKTTIDEEYLIPKPLAARQAPVKSGIPQSYQAAKLPSLPDVSKMPLDKSYLGGAGLTSSASRVPSVNEMPIYKVPASYNAPKVLVPVSKSVASSVKKEQLMIPNTLKNVSSLAPSQEKDTPAPQVLAAAPGASASAEGQSEGSKKKIGFWGF